ncbi:MAG: hypothetical protein R3E32_27095 [Chitinophagales bacterium]
MNTRKIRKHKENLIKLLILIGFFTSLFSDNPITNVFFVFFLGIVLVYGVYDKIRYRQGKYPNEIRYPTQNDTYYKVTSLTLGTIVILGAVIWLVLTTELIFIPYIGLVMGGLVLANGILDFSNGKLKIENKHLDLLCDDKPIEIEEIESIYLLPNQLIVLGVNGKKITQTGLKLDEKWAVKIEEFLKQNTDNQKYEIRNHF